MSRGRFAPWPMLAMLWSVAAYADHPSLDFAGGGTGAIATIPATTLPKGGAAFGIRAEYVKPTRLSDEELQRRAARGIGAHGADYLFSPSLSAAYGVSDDFMVGVRLPYLRRASLREGAENGGVTDRGNSAGVGDATVLGKYRFTGDGNAYQAALLFGVKAPTGKTDRRDRQGERFETEHQPGSGSWDPLLGLAMTTRLGAASVDASFLYTIAGKGAQHSKLGDRASYSLGISHAIGGEREHHHGGHATSPHAHNAWAAVLELNGEWEGRRATGGVTDPESGGNELYLSPGLRFVSSSRWSAFLSLGVPVVQHLRLSHPENDYRVIAGIGWAL